MNTNIDKNIEYYSRKDITPCDCKFCQYFCEHVSEKYPAVDVYLNSLGIDIHKPFELIYFEDENKGIIEYVSCQYIVFGECEEDFEMSMGDVKITNNTNCHPSTNIKEYHFILDFGTVMLNWKTYN